MALVGLGLWYYLLLYLLLLLMVLDPWVWQSWLCFLLLVCSCMQLYLGICILVYVLIPT